jgi:hypothetical protein
VSGWHALAVGFAVAALIASAFAYAALSDGGIARRVIWVSSLAFVLACVCLLVIDFASAAAHRSGPEPVGLFAVAALVVAYVGLLFPLAVHRGRTNPLSGMSGVEHHTETSVDVGTLRTLLRWSSVYALTLAALGLVAAWALGWPVWLGIALGSAGVAGLVAVTIIGSDKETKPSES